MEGGHPPNVWLDEEGGGGGWRVVSLDLENSLDNLQILTVHWFCIDMMFKSTFHRHHQNRTKAS